MEHILYWIWITNALKFGKIKKLHKIAGNVEEIYFRDNYDEFPFLTDDDKKALLDKRTGDARKLYDECVRLGIRIIVWDDRRFYPPMLRHISKPPLILYAKGIIPDWKSIFTLGIVGTRNMTEYGERVTEEFAEGLVKAGVTVVTGFARGNDIVATRVALRHNAFSIALFGSGVDVVYPSENGFEYDKMLECGLILSEQPPGTRPDKWNFPKRNRILAGICNGVLVTEAPKVSGALITAHIAAEEGRDVFAIPGNIGRSKCVGTNILIQEGAKPVMSYEDILCEYPVFAQREPEKEQDETIVEPEENEPEKTEIKEGTTEDKILELLSVKDTVVDEMISELGISATECNSICFMLELSGKITRLPGNIYHRNEN